MAQENTILDSLRAVQLGLKVPKDRANEFAHFQYRKAEDIIQHVKPLLDKAGLTLIVSDGLEHIGDRYYIVATASVAHGKGTGERISCTAYAREAEDKKGMDVAQITGSASSYARKYALSGLFAIDNSDIPDLDSQEHEAPPVRLPVKKAEPPTIVDDEETDGNKIATAPQKVEIVGLLKGIGVATADMANFVESVIGKPRIETYDDYQQVKEAIAMESEPAS